MGVDLERVWAVVPCMGRLPFLQRTLPAFLGQEPRAMRYCLVDYSCPDGCGAWAERAFAAEVAAGRLAIERVPGQAHFHKSRAHNLGAGRAMRAGAAVLCFLDADTLVRPGLGAWVAAHAGAGRFLVAARDGRGHHVRSTGGLLVVAASDFQAAGGFDEAFVGWGCEDVEIRLRLHLARGLDYGDVPLDLIEPIPHSDRLRGNHYAVTDIRQSERRNRRIVERKIRAWTGGTTTDLAPLARRLLMGRIFRAAPERRGPSRFVRRSWR
jgi:hypothetical protein